jgi:multidrug transporter EmrE-like cation transporter
MASSASSTPLVSMGLFAVAAFLGALGQFLYKSGAERLVVSNVLTWLNPRLLGGVACYIAVMVLFVAAFKRGGHLTTLYPIYASTFIWAAVIAWLAFQQPIKPANVAGMALLIAGMWLMGKR